MFNKKKQIHRVLFGACEVEAGGAVSQPVKATIAVVKPPCAAHLCCQWRPRSSQVSKFYFRETRVITRRRIYTSYTAALDLETLFRRAAKYSDSCEVKISIRFHLGQKHGVRIGLDSFLEKLMRRGPPDEFLLQVNNGKVFVKPFLSGPSVSYVQGKGVNAGRIKQQAFWSDTLRNIEECGDARRLEGEEEEREKIRNDAREAQKVEERRNVWQKEEGSEESGEDDATGKSSSEMNEESEYSEEESGWETEYDDEESEWSTDEDPSVDEEREGESELEKEYDGEESEWYTDENNTADEESENESRL